MHRLTKYLLIAAGTISLALGVIGIVVPGLPTTPFLLLSAACFVRSSPRLLQWLNHNRLFGEYIRNYREGRGIPRRQKVITIASLWLMIGASSVFFIEDLWIKVMLIIIGISVSAYLFFVKSASAGHRANHPNDHDVV